MEDAVLLEKIRRHERAVSRRLEAMEDGGQSKPGGAEKELDDSYQEILGHICQSADELIAKIDYLLRLICTPTDQNTSVAGVLDAIVSDIGRCYGHPTEKPTPEAASRSTAHAGGPSPDLPKLDYAAVKRVLGKATVSQVEDSVLMAMQAAKQHPRGSHALMTLLISVLGAVIWNDKRGRGGTANAMRDVVRQLSTGLATLAGEPIRCAPDCRGGRRAGGCACLRDARTWSDLSGQRILVVAEEHMLAADTARAVRDAGALVLGPCSTADRALAELHARRPTAAIVDVNAEHGPGFEVARTLCERAIPFIFLTGHGEDAIPAELRHIPRLEKPVTLGCAVNAIAAALDLGRRVS